eukprot:s57_g46.t2
MPRWLLYLLGSSLLAAGTVLGLSLHLLVAGTGEDDAAHFAHGLRLPPSTADVPRRVPVVVVEEHHEALPYWRKALRNDPSTPAAVLHFDAHSDLALPHQSAKAEDFGLASNDEFVLAAALEGLVDRFIWVFPTWDSKGPKHRHNRLGVSRRVLVLGRTKSGEPCCCESKDLPLSPERLASPLGWTATWNESNDSQCNDAEESSVVRGDCEVSKLLQVVMVREEKLSALKAWWPTLLAAPLLLDVDEDHFAQKTEPSRLAHLHQRLQALKQLQCPANTSEALVTLQLRRSIAAMLREEAIGSPASSLTELGCNEQAAVTLMKELNSMHQLDLELLLLYGFCFSTSAQTLLAAPEERYLRVCDVGTEETTRDTDRDPSETALSEESRAIAARLRAFEGSLKSLEPWVHRAVLVSLCRSVRDGFTPNRVWSQIESRLLQLLGGMATVTFDANLLGGAGGWENWTKYPRIVVLAFVLAGEMSFVQGLGRRHSNGWPVEPCGSCPGGEALAVVDDSEGKTAKEVKRSLAAQVGVSRFRQRFWSEDWSHEIQDDDVFTSDLVNVQLVVLDFLPPEIQEDQKMIAASRDNDLPALEALLRGPRTPRVTDVAGRTPLHSACENGHGEPMRLLLEAGAAADARDTSPQGWTPLLLAALRGHVDTVGLLLEGRAEADLATVLQGATALFMAAQNGHVEVVRLLIDTEADCEKARTDTGTTPLFIAAEKGHVNVARLLYEAGADCDKASTDDGTTPLYIAAQNGHVEVVRLLLEAGVDRNKARTDTGTTPLYIAAEKGHMEVVSLLIEAGADYDKARSDTGITPLFIAAHKGHVEVAHLLIEAGVDLEKATTDIGATPLFIAAQNGHMEVVRLLLEAGADRNKARTDTGAPPLRIAAEQGHVNIVRLLKEAGE